MTGWTAVSHPTSSRVTRNRYATFLFRGIPTGALFILWAMLAHADIYAFRDEKGTVHFSNVPNDARYRLLVISPTSRQHAPVPPPRKSRHLSVLARSWLANSSPYEGLVQQAARDASLSADLVRAVIAIESGFNPHCVSKKGAIGLMQLEPATAYRYGARNPFDPEQNVRAGSRYLSDLAARFGGDLELALAAYNAGEDAVERYGRRIPPFPETQAYVPSVLGLYRALLAQAK